MNMAYKVVYIEDLDADSVLHDLSLFELAIEHCKPTTFTETIANVDSKIPDLILMDFRLMAGGGEVDAPAIAQYYRSRAIDHPEKNIPIVLLSNDSKIHGYYDDFTSHDLFDFSISKEYLSEKKDKYALLIKELIDSYQTVAELQKQKQDLIQLLNVPESIKDDLDPRINETLSSKKFQSNTYMVSAFILNSIVKPIGVLIGEDVLSARLGVSKSSRDWNLLCEQLDEVAYKGLYSGAYRRWWSTGVDNWWLRDICETNHLRRLSSDQKLEALHLKFGDMQLNKVEGDPMTKTDSFWSVCQYSFVPVDPSEAFEIQPDLTTYPWLEPKYYSFESVRNNDLNDSLTELERIRFKEIARRN